MGRLDEIRAPGGVKLSLYEGKVRVGPYLPDDPGNCVLMQTAS